jgi:hypothetical protein
MIFKAPSPSLYLGSLLIAGLLGAVAYWILQTQAPGNGVLLTTGLLIGHLVGICVRSRPATTPATHSTPPTNTGFAQNTRDTVSLYVGNLAYSARRDALQTLFAQYGNVHSVRIMTDRATRKPRGYGFVEIDHAAAQTAINALNNSEFCGRTLRVNEAKQRQAGY